jgi:hypothetical protein
MFMDAQDKLSTGEPQGFAIQLARETYTILHASSPLLTRARSKLRT